MAPKTDILKWARAFPKAKQNKPAKPDKLDRYTNFTLQNVWEKFDCQTSLLCREAMIPLMQKQRWYERLDLLIWGVQNMFDEAKNIFFFV